jgi:predicted thioesterase
MIEPDPGTSASERQVVQGRDLASTLSAADMTFPPVYATSRMVALMELAAARVMLPLLGDGELSVGVTVEIRHTAPTPEGRLVTAIATFAGREGNLFVFDVVASDDAGEIGRGVHKRAIVTESRLLQSAARRFSGK